MEGVHGADPSECVRAFTDKSAATGARSDNLPDERMSTLLDSIRSAISTPRGGRPVCLVCGRAMSPSDESLKLRGGALVHRAVAFQTASQRQRLGRLVVVTGR